MIFSLGGVLDSISKYPILSTITIQTIVNIFLIWYFYETLEQYLCGVQI